MEKSQTPPAEHRALTPLAHTLLFDTPTMTHRWRAASALLSCCMLACGGQSKSDAQSGPDNDSSITSTTSTSDTGGTGGTGDATTGDGGVCKAPPIGALATNPAGCTDFEPSVGEACSEAGLVCDYDFCVFPFYGAYHQLTCTDGRWVRTIDQECQPPTCLPPVIGEACDEALTPGPCEILNACEDSLPAFCKAGVWETQCREIEPADPPDVGLDSNCPIYPPTLGDPCCPRWYAPACDFSEFLEDGSSAASVGAATGSNGSGAPWMPTGPITACVRCNADSFAWEASDECE